jgi:hypothetical protein
MGGVCSRYGGVETAYKTLFVKPVVKLPFVKPTYRWEENTKMDLKEIWCLLDSSGSG